MRRRTGVFLIGTLCGVMMAVALTYAVVIPANNAFWRVEIVKRGGGSWYFDKNGKLGWIWTVQPITDRKHTLKIIVPAQPQRISDSSQQKL